MKGRFSTDGNEKDLIIIGAGIDGLSTGLAYALHSDLQPEGKRLAATKLQLDEQRVTESCYHAG